MNKCFALALTFSLVSGSITQAGFVLEQFNYPNGTVAGKTGGTGFIGPWTGASGQTVDDGELRITGNNRNMATRNLASTVSNTVYFSFNFRFTGNVGDNDFFSLWFDSDADNRPNVGLKGNQGNGSGTGDFFARLTLGGETYGPNLVVGQTYFLVGKLTKGVTNFDQITLWVNPTDETGGITAGGAGTISQFSKIGIRTANLDNGDTVYFDNFQMGDTFESVQAVQAVPAPPALLLAALGVPAFGLVRRWSRKSTAHEVVV